MIKTFQSVIVVLIATIFFATSFGCSSKQIIKEQKLISDPIPQIDSVKKNILDSSGKIDESISKVQKNLDSIDKKTNDQFIKDRVSDIKILLSGISNWLAQTKSEASKLEAINVDIKTLRDDLVKTNKQFQDFIEQSKIDQEKAVKKVTEPLDKEIAKLKKSSEEGMKSVYAIMASLAGIGAIIVAIGAFVMFGMKDTVKGSGIVIGGMLMIGIAIAVIKQSMIISIIGSAAVAIIVIILILKIILDQRVVNKEVIQTNEITKNELRKAAPDRAEKLYGSSDNLMPGDIESKIQSDVTINAVAKERSLLLK